MATDLTKITGLQLQHIIPYIFYTIIFSSSLDLLISITVYCTVLYIINQLWRELWRLDNTYWPDFLDVEWLIDEDLFNRGKFYLISGFIASMSTCLIWWRTFGIPRTSTWVYPMPYLKSNIIRNFYQWLQFIVWAKVMATMEECYFRVYLNFALDKNVWGQIIGATCLSFGPFLMFNYLTSNPSISIIVATLLWMVNMSLYELNEKKGLLECVCVKQGVYFGIGLCLILRWYELLNFQMPDKVEYYNTNNIWSVLSFKNYGV